MVQAYQKRSKHLSTLGFNTREAKQSLNLKFSAHNRRPFGHCRGNKSQINSIISLVYLLLKLAPAKRSPLSDILDQPFLLFHGAIQLKNNLRYLFSFYVPKPFTISPLQCPKYLYTNRYPVLFHSQCLYYLCNLYS